MKIGILGAEGLLGRELTRLSGGKGYTRQEADLCDLELLRHIAAKEKFTHLFNCGAYNDVDRAQVEEKRAFAVNATGPENLAHLGKEFGIQIVHVSTDYVFSGDKGVPYLEEDICAPLSAYGESKRKGEERLLSLLPSACVVRTSWLFGPGGRNFLSSLLQKMQTEKEIKVEAVQISRPTLVHDLAQGLLKLKDESGLFHYASGEPTNRYTIACLLHLEALKAGWKLACEKIIPLSSPLSQRPLYSALSTEKIEAMGLKPFTQEELLWQWLNVYS